MASRARLCTKVQLAAILGLPVDTPVAVMKYSGFSTYVLDAQLAANGTVRLGDLLEQWLERLGGVSGARTYLASGGKGSLVYVGRPSRSLTLLKSLAALLAEEQPAVLEGSAGVYVAQNRALVNAQATKRRQREGPRKVVYVVEDGTARAERVNGKLGCARSLQEYALAVAPGAKPKRRRVAARALPPSLITPERNARRAILVAAEIEEAAVVRRVSKRVGNAGALPAAAPSLPRPDPCRSQPSRRRSRPNCASRPRTRHVRPQRQLVLLWRWAPPSQRPNARLQVAHTVAQRRPYADAAGGPALSLPLRGLAARSSRLLVLSTVSLASATTHLEATWLSPNPMRLTTVLRRVGTSLLARLDPAACTALVTHRRGEACARVEGCTGGQAGHSAMCCTKDCACDARLSLPLWRR